MESIIDVLAEHGGIATRRQLIDRGITGMQLSVAVKLGEIGRVRRAHYATHDVDLDRRAAVRVGGRLGCRSALAAMGLWSGLSGGCVHVSLPHNAARLRTRSPLSVTDRPGADEVVMPDRFGVPVRLHWCDGRFGHRRDDESAWRVDVRTALAEMAGCADRRDIRAAFESAVHAGSLTLDEAQLLVDRASDPEAEPMHLSARSGSGAESHLVEELIEQGLAFEQQVDLEGVGRVDFLVDGCLVVEIDGYRFHRTRRQFEFDRQRDAAALRLGLPTLRIPARVLLRHPDRASAMLRDAIAGVRALRA
ncbi:very-short-patch-repair endonuclease [Agromyces terreus]|uniref:Very-short-patch-repair endonuclease n=1 Tax=Agromyces terreus TaxID=424795 RepID=A0A9X2GY87_9MICO|nr:type IV toxin-antitoxin system AbiEi family antitoxin domain-containing protein [Agromyces terreus]MCP2371265.1 very-short-patch-repair endonuclease [Agromyces terreus]